MRVAILLWSVGTLASAWAVTAGIRRYALSRSMVDIPNHRSSHKVPTPRGGGLAIVIASVGAWLMMPVLGVGSPAPWLAIGAAVLVAGIGWVDDHRHVPAMLRLGGHAAAAALITWSLGGLPLMTLEGLGMSVSLGTLVAVFIVAWWINLTNFMDGIDGIAAVQVSSVCLGGAGVHLAAGSPVTLALGPVALAAASLGFLIWNWPPARIFMGDVGSGFVGATVGLFTLQAGQVSGDLMWAWIILSATFVTDASVTLVARALRRERLFEAHRSHCYQRLAQGRGHLPVTLLVLAINVVWLLPIALAVGAGQIDGAVAAAAAYTPLVVVVSAEAVAARSKLSA